MVIKGTWFDDLEKRSNINVVKKRLYQKPGPTIVKK